MVDHNKLAPEKQVVAVFLNRKDRDKEAKIINSCQSLFWFNACLTFETKLFWFSTVYQIDQILMLKNFSIVFIVSQNGILFCYCK